jgi:YD repeat-containing protein
MNKMWTKYLVNTVSAFLALMAGSGCCQAQYYYKDVVVTAQIADNYRLLRANKITGVQVMPYELDNPLKEGVTLKQTIYPGQSLVVTYTKVPDAGESWLKAYYSEAGQLTTTVDSTEDVVTRSQYAYDASGRLASISSSSVPKNDPTETEIHQWTYNAAGKPSKMLKVKNNTDTSFIVFEADDQGNVGEEKVSRNRVSLGSTFYYYDSNNHITDVARYNKKADRILPDYMFQYNDAGQVSQMIIVPEGSSDYQTWKYTYNSNGLKQEDACYNKQKQLMGKVEYSYIKP